MFTNFDDLDKNSRVWVYQAAKPFSEEESQLILKNGQEFIESWTAHNVALSGSVTIKHDYFIILSVDESQTEASGCSIDKSVHFIRTLENELNIPLLDRSKVAFLAGDKISVKNLHEIKSKVQSKEITAEMLTFDNTIMRKSDLETKWLIPANESWMSRFFTANV